MVGVSGKVCLKGKLRQVDACDECAPECSLLQTCLWMRARPIRISKKIKTPRKKELKKAQRNSLCLCCEPAHLFCFDLPSKSHNSLCRVHHLINERIFASPDVAMACSSCASLRLPELRKTVVTK